MDLHVNTAKRITREEIAISCEKHGKKRNTHEPSKHWEALKHSAPSKRATAMEKTHKIEYQHLSQSLFPCSQVFHLVGSVRFSVGVVW